MSQNLVFNGEQWNHFFCLPFTYNSIGKFILNDKYIEEEEELELV